MGVDSLVNSSVDGITTQWEPTTNILAVNVDKFEMEAEIVLDLSEDTHFDRGIAAEETVDLDGFDAGLDEERQVRGDFDFLPEVDLQYFLDNAVTIHTENWHEWSNNTFPNGIHVFTGYYLTLENVRLTSGTLVFLGHNIRFLYGNDITAAAGDTSGTYPAVIFTNPAQNFEAYSRLGDESITGAIYCKGDVTLYNGHFSGPIMGKNVSLHNNFSLKDTENADRYRWTKGFGNRDSYDWPKQIRRWKTRRWHKKINI